MNAVKQNNFSDMPIWMKPFLVVGFCGAIIEKFGRFILFLGAWPLITKKSKAFRLLLILTFPLLIIAFVAVVVGTFLRMPMGVYLTSRAKNKA
ncbi:MAG TPA: hypothetical protein VHG89_03165 [Verrucomicrobiae bacterium]|nr:hypothetical protein [Verrucomicrobiae bacterium]